MKPIAVDLDDSLGKSAGDSVLTGRRYSAVP